MDKRDIGRRNDMWKKKAKSRARAGTCVTSHWDEGAPRTRLPSVVEKARPSAQKTESTDEKMTLPSIHPSRAPDRS